MKGRGLTAAEHSRLVYLLDALEAAPGKRAQLLSLAEKEGASEACTRALDGLRKPSIAELRVECVALRKALR